MGVRSTQVSALQDIRSSGKLDGGGETFSAATPSASGASDGDLSLSPTAVATPAASSRLGVAAQRGGAESISGGSSVDNGRGSARLGAARRRTKRHAAGVGAGGGGGGGGGGGSSVLGRGGGGGGGVVEDAPTPAAAVAATRSAGSASSPTAVVSPGWLSLAGGAGEDSAFSALEPLVGVG